MILEFIDPAEDDILETAAFYQVHGELGDAFLDEVEHALNRILQYPRGWTKLSRRTRRRQLNRFPYGIIYQVRGDAVRIVAVLDLRREPDSWRSRLAGRGEPP